MGLLGLHTSFEHGKTFNVLFELANKGSLANLMTDTDPPRTGWQIYEHWKALLEVLNALGRIHGHKDDGDRRKVFQGYAYINCLILREHLLTLWQDAPRCLSQEHPGI